MIRPLDGTVCCVCLFLIGLFKVRERLTQVLVPSWRLSAALADLQEETRIEPEIMAETRASQTVGCGLEGGFGLSLSVFNY